MRSISKILLVAIFTVALGGCVEEIEKYQGFYKLKICSEDTDKVWKALDLRVKDATLNLKFYDRGTVSHYIFNYENSIGPKDYGEEKIVKTFAIDPTRPLIRKYERQWISWAENLMWIRNRVYEYDDNPENPSQKLVSQSPEFAIEFHQDSFTLKFSIREGYTNSTPPIPNWHKFECEYEKE